MNRRLLGMIGGAVVLAVVASSAARQTAAAVQGGATVSGKVKFTGARPTNPKIDMSEEAACKAKYPTAPTEETVIVNANGTLANVFVYVKAGLPAGGPHPGAADPRAPDPHRRRHPPPPPGHPGGAALHIQDK